MTAPAADREVSGWLLRAVLLVVCLLAVALAVFGETGTRLGTVSVVGTVAVLVGTVLLPGSLVPGVLIAVLALAVLDREAVPLVLLVVMAGLLHAIHLLAGLAALGPPATRYRVAGLLPTLRRWALSQLVAFPVVVAWSLAGSGVRATGVDDAVEVAAGVVALLLLVGVVVLARRRMTAP